MLGLFLFKSQSARNFVLNLSRTQQEREESAKRTRRSLSRSLDAKRFSKTRDSEDEEEEEEEEEENYSRTKYEKEEDNLRYRRSQSRGRSVIREPDDYRSQRDLAKDSRRLSRKSEEREPVQRQARASRIFSSESDEEQQRKVERRQAGASVSDEEDWESELRIRRKQFMEKLATRDSLPEQGSLTSLRRSSAEGKLALLKDPTADDNMDSWTVSVGSRGLAQLGSSQERSEPEDEYSRQRREYREQAPPPREDTQSEEEVIWDASRRRSYTSSSQMTSLEEDDDVESYNFVLTKDSKRISLQDLSRLSQEDPDLAESGWNVVRREGENVPRSSSGLYKRESIIKSQASEEDPEYLLPERPKLVQQEREHPFKKAWQMQKSRSEEDAYIIKESKESKESKEQAETESKSKDDGKTKESKEGGEQYEDTGEFADDESESTMLTRSRSSDTDENTRMSSKSEEIESTSTDNERSKSSKKDSVRSSDVEEDSSRSSWPSEEEQVYRTGARSKSEETEWNWQREET